MNENNDSQVCPVCTGPGWTDLNPITGERIPCTRCDGSGEIATLDPLNRHQFENCHAITEYQFRCGIRRIIA